MRKRRLSKYKQGRLVEHFVAGTTARTAARLCGVNRKTAALYFLRLREIIADELEVESVAIFGGEIEVDESYFGGNARTSVGVVRQEKSLYLDYLSGEERSIPRSSRTLPQPH